MTQDSTLAGFMSVLEKEGWDLSKGVTNLIASAKNAISPSPESRFNLGVTGATNYFKNNSWVDMLGGDSLPKQITDYALNDPHVLRGVNSVVGPKFYNAAQVNSKGGINMTSPLDWNYGKFFEDHPLVSSGGVLGLGVAGGSLLKGLFGKKRNQPQFVNRSNMLAPRQPYHQMNFEKYSG